MSAYQTFLPDCECGKGNGILFKDNVPHCRWCLKAWGHGGMINYNDESFKAIPSPPTTIDTKSKEWEILEFKNTVGQTLRLYENEHYRWDYSHGNSNGWLLKDILANNFIIHSVKRLSDGEVFSVGDEVEYNGLGEWYCGKVEKIGISASNKNEILFEIKGDIGEEDNARKFIGNLRRKQKSKPQDTFTWTDELVKEFADNLPIDVMAGDVEIKLFKQSKAHIPKEEKMTDWSKVQGLEIDHKKEMEKFMQMAFDAGRDRIGGFWNDQIKNWKHNSFSDYLQTIKSSSK